VRSLGRVDLSYTSGPLRLVVALKLDAKFRSGQIADCAQSSHRVLAVVRDPIDALAQAGDAGARWLGATAWKDLIPRLRSLPVLEQRSRELCLALLEIGERSRDFNRVKPDDPSAVERKRVLESVRDRISRYLGVGAV
jgi:hypothetical protein